MEDKEEPLPGTMGMQTIREPMQCSENHKLLNFVICCTFSLKAPWAYLTAGVTPASLEPLQGGLGRAQEEGGDLTWGPDLECCLSVLPILKPKGIHCPTPHTPPKRKNREHNPQNQRVVRQRGTWRYPANTLFARMKILSPWRRQHTLLCSWRRHSPEVS